MLPQYLKAENLSLEREVTQTSLCPIKVGALRTKNNHFQGGNVAIQRHVAVALPLFFPDSALNAGSLTFPKGLLSRTPLQCFSRCCDRQQELCSVTVGEPSWHCTFGIPHNLSLHVFLIFLHFSNFPRREFFIN